MDRKNFIQQSAMAAAALALTPSILSAQDKQPVLGHNKKKYKLNTKWSKQDFAKYPVKDCHEMVQDKKGRIILLTNETKNNVIIYNKKGKVLTTWGDNYPGAHGLTLFD